MNYQKQFEQLVKKYIIEFSKDDDEQSEEEWQQSQDFFESIYEQLEEIQNKAPNFVLNKFEANLEKLDIWVLHILVEFVRAGGLPRDQTREMFEVLLRLCFKVLEAYKDIDAYDPLFFIIQTYDTIWHTGLGDYEEDFYPLYFDLTRELLDDKYFTLENQDNKSRYNTIIYWILMSSYYFKKQDDDFRLIFNRLQQNPHYRNDSHLEKRWQEHYEEINN